MKLPTFRDTIDELDRLQEAKGSDYGSEDDPLYNLRASEMFGTPAWLGSIIRANDKINRIATFARRGALVNESVEDSLRDLAVYAIHALRLYREANKQED